MKFRIFPQDQYGFKTYCNYVTEPEVSRYVNSTIYLFPVLCRGYQHHEFLRVTSKQTIYEVLILKECETLMHLSDLVERELRGVE